MTPSNNNLYITSLKEMVALSLLGVAGNIAPFILPLIVGGLVDHVGLTVQQASYVASADMFGLGFGTLIWSHFILKANWRKFALLSALLLFAGNLVCAFADNFAAAALSRFVAGTGGGLMLTIGVSGLANTLNPDRIVAVYTLLVTVVATVVLYVFPFVLEASGARGMFLAMAGFACAAGISSFFVPPRSVSAGNVHRDDASGGPAASLWLRSMAVAGVLTSFFGLSLFWVYIERAAVLSGFGTGQISGLLGTAQACGVAGAVFAAVVATRFGNRMFPVMLAMGLSLMASAVIPGAAAFALYLAAGCALIFSWNMVYPYVIGIMVSLDPTAKLVAYAMVMMTLGKSLSPMVGAWFVTDTHYDPAYWLCVGVFVLSILLFYPALRFTDRRLGKPATDVDTALQMR